MVLVNYIVLMQFILEFNECFLQPVSVAGCGSGPCWF